MNNLNSILTCEQCRTFDRIATEQFGIPGLILMENAARNCVEILLRQDSFESAAVICGTGNNGGDGFAIARLLKTAGKDVQIILLGEIEKFTQDTAVNWRIAQNLGIKTTTWQVEIKNLSELEQTISNLSVDWIIDSMLGTGTSLPLREPFVRAVEILNRSDAHRLAVDIPTGLDGDCTTLDSNWSKSPSHDYPAFRAELTVTFVAAKPVMTTKLGQEFCGLIEVVDIGVPITIGNYL